MSRHDNNGTGQFSNKKVCFLTYSCTIWIKIVQANWISKHVWYCKSHLGTQITALANPSSLTHDCCAPLTFRYGTPSVVWLERISNVTSPAVFALFRHWETGRHTIVRVYSHSECPIMYVWWRLLYTPGRVLRQHTQRG